MKNNKTPGNDGIPIEFYKIFWNQIGKFLLRSLNEAFIKGELSITQKQSVITCIPKGDKPKQFLKNWRPISLLNVDYKILSGVLAKRMKMVLPSVISSNQKGFMKNRYIGENTRLVYDIISELNCQDKSGIILLADFEKAFDTLEWDYIKTVLTTYNFGPNFVKWFNILYKDACSCVINNGTYSTFFKLERGCRQGDPLSPYIFILCIDPLSITLDASDKIGGIKLKDKTYKVGLYADDTFLLLDGTEQSIRESFKTLSEFSLLSGLKVNVNKTQIAWIGSNGGLQIDICPDLHLQWVTEFNLLGITFSNDLAVVEEINYHKVLGRLTNILKIYKNQYLTLIGKITIIKSLAISQLIHLISVLPSPNKSIMDEIYKILKNFLWNGKRPKLSWEKLSLDIEKGGLKLTNLNIFIQGLKISWVQRLQKEGNWQSLFQETICGDKKLIWNLDKDSLTKKSKMCKNRFWREVLSSWCQYKFSTNIYDLSYVIVSNYPIWHTSWNNNTNILYKKQQFIDRDIKYIKHLLNKDGKLYNYNEFINKTAIQINFLDYHSLLKSIPKAWVNILKTGNINDYHRSFNYRDHTLTKILQEDKVSRSVYRSLIDKQNIHKNNENKWEEDLQINIDWRTTYKRIKEVTMQSKVQEFQYKLLHRILPTNKFLKMCNIVESDQCYFCSHAVETLSHIFFDCIHIRALWDELCDWLDPYIDFTPYCKKPIIMIGANLPENNTLVNHILFLVKRYIYVTKCVENNLSIFGLRNFIKSCYVMEKEIANTVDNIGKPKSKRFVEKWRPIQYLLL